MKEDAFADSEAAEACCCCSRLRNFDSALLISNGPIENFIRALPHKAVINCVEIRAETLSLSKR